jgi:hypothetical protein
VCKRQCRNYVYWLVNSLLFACSQLMFVCLVETFVRFCVLPGGEKAPYLWLSLVPRLHICDLPLSQGSIFETFPCRKALYLWLSLVPCYFFLAPLHFGQYYVWLVDVKVKQFLYRPITGPKDFSWLRLPDFKTVGSALRLGLLYPPWNNPAGRILPMRNFNDTIGNRVRDLPACSAVPRSTAPLLPAVFSTHPQ